MSELTVDWKANRPPGCTCKDPHDVCEACSGVTRVMPPLPQLKPVTPSPSAKLLWDTIRRWLKHESQQEVYYGLDRGKFREEDTSTWEICGVDIEKALQSAARLKGGHWVKDHTYAGGFRWVKD